MLHFSDEIKLYVLFGCALVLALSLLIVICFILPPSWICLRRRDDELPDETVVQLKDLQRLASDDLLRPTRSVSLSSIASFDDQHQIVRMVNSRSTSRLSRSDAVSFQSQDSGRHSLSSADVSVADTPTTSRSGSLDSESSKCPQVTLHLQYDQLTDEANPQLIVNIESASDLPNRTYMEQRDPSVSIRLERRSFSFRGRRRDVMADAISGPVFRSRNPNFQYKTTFPLQKHFIKDCHLIIKVDDTDKLTGASELGSARLSLRELEELPSGSLLELTRPLTAPIPQDKGDAFIGLSFLPTSQRITVQILEFNQLRGFEKSDKFQYVARLFLLNECGRVLKKRKTAPLDSAVRMNFDQQFNIDVEIERWERSVLLIVLSRFEQLEKSSSCTSTGRKPPLYVHLGHLALGKRVATNGGRIHWNSAFQNPRKTIVQWHSLN